ncbi:Heavy-metal-associated domain protein [Anatilimnocola aggregata]|uniref:Heavy-metal-associated domain protein n=1 Tax=Anatilimnocola aggregata TaxID=2528021 RepID=A0A517YAN5_9BACT|nr:heavy metal-associated domain-containing protein [Anatilimnocola aggregata]QDU27293.1 Heavy-metal-associated domain protein [Anatilimnocola aggregata]
MRCFILLITVAVTCLSAAALQAADDVPVERAQLTLRVTGLFAPDREADLRELMMLIPDVALVSVDYLQAEAVFEYEPNKAFDKAKPDKIPERIDNAIRTNSRGTFGAKPLSGLAKDKLQNVDISVVGLDCKGCALAAYESVAKVDGVERATASFKTGLVTARFDPAKTDRAALEAALVKARVELKKPLETTP